uniref:Vitamin B12-dependent ribonucleotide reductase n=1 Tax=viral metagenome TaxID=1070528 RepID=A0A6M3JXF9_9ZZZZ
MLERVSFGNLDYYNMMAELKFLPNSPTLFNLGTGQGTYAACYALYVDDSLDSIMDVARKSAILQKWGGGVGYYVSDLRPKGSPVRSTQGSACGPLSVIHLYQAVADMITQGGKRHGAQIAVMNCTHPDIHEFIHCKAVPPECFCSKCPLQDDCENDRNKELNTFNLSVACTEEFMSTAVQDPESPEGKLLQEMAENAWQMGDPGILFIDSINVGNPHVKTLGRLKGANPCGETPLFNNEACNLGSINLTKFVLPDNTIDWHGLAETTKLAVRYLDQVMEEKAYPLPEVVEAVERTRKLGLGVMGWADMLALLRMPYDSKEAVDLGGDIMEYIQEAAHTESRLIGKEKGCDWGLDRRHTTLTCIAPTGTISILAGCSSGIEPHHSLKHTRTMGDGTLLTEEIDFGGFTPKTALEIPWEYHIKHQAGFQEFVDLAVSKTVNMPNTATTTDIWNAFVYAWQEGCKGSTVYRDRSKTQQVLNVPTPPPTPQAAVLNRPIRRRLPRTAPAVRHKFSVGGTDGYLHHSSFKDGKLGELFITMSNQGSTIDGLLNALAIITSIALQHGVSEELIEEKFRKTKFEPSGLTDDPNVPIATSILNYIARYLAPKNAAQIVDTDTGMFCEECGAAAVMEEGCQRCSNSCGWSRCG